MPAMKFLCVVVFIHILMGCQCLESGQGQAASKCASVTKYDRCRIPMPIFT